MRATERRAKWRAFLVAFVRRYGFLGRAEASLCDCGGYPYLHRTALGRECRNA